MDSPVHPGQNLRSLSMKTFSSENAARKKIENSVNLADLLTLPMQTQLLIAHFMERGNSHLLLRECDTDLCRLVGTRWLLPDSSSRPGYVAFTIEPSCWRQMMALRGRFLTGRVLHELESYRQQKSSAYPWVW